MYVKVDNLYAFNWEIMICNIINLGQVYNLGTNNNTGQGIKLMLRISSNVDIRSS